MTRLLLLIVCVARATTPLLLYNCPTIIDIYVVYLKLNLELANSQMGAEKPLAANLAVGAVV